MLSEDLENEMEDEYDMSEMVMVKKMIGLNMSDANDNSKPEDAEDAEDTEDAKDTEDSVKNLLCKSHKIYDFDNPSSKVSNCSRIPAIQQRNPLRSFTILHISALKPSSWCRRSYVKRAIRLWWCPNGRPC